MLRTDRIITPLSYLISILVFSFCVQSESLAQSNLTNSTEAASSQIMTYDDQGESITIITAIKDDSNSVHQNSRISKLSDEFYCSGHKINSLISERFEGPERISVSLDITYDGMAVPKKNIKPYIQNMHEFQFIDNQFACYDNTARLNLIGVRFNSTIKSEMNLEFFSEIIFNLKTGKILEAVN